MSIEGLEYMNDDPGEVDVLYAKVQEHSGRLQVLRRIQYQFKADHESVFS